MISIIIPTLNEGKELETTLRQFADGLKSIPYEIIISDGKSKDLTVEIAKKFTQKIAIYSGSTRQTIAMAKNDGARLASGDYFAFMDADITIPDVDNFFKRAVSDFENDKRLVGLGSKIRVLPELETFADRFFRTLHNTHNRFMNNILHLGTGPGEFQMVRAEAFKKIGGFNEKIIASEDHDFFSRLAKIGRTHFDRNLTVYEKGRRAHKVGWLKLMTIWTMNGISVSLFGHSVSKEWKEIR